MSDLRQQGEDTEAPDLPDDVDLDYEDYEY